MTNKLNGMFGYNSFNPKTFDDNRSKKDLSAIMDDAENKGFKHTSTIKMMLNTRPGVGNDKLSGREKFEGVYVFRRK